MLYDIVQVIPYEDYIEVSCEDKIFTCIRGQGLQ